MAFFNFHRKQRTPLLFVTRAVPIAASQDLAFWGLNNDIVHDTVDFDRTVILPSRRLLLPCSYGHLLLLLRKCAAFDAWAKARFRSRGVRTPRSFKFRNAALISGHRAPRNAQLALAGAPQCNIISHILNFYSYQFIENLR